MIANSKGKYILTLDADMIPSKEIIMKMIYYFEDSKTGFVQAPQVFYNHDIFQYNLEIGDDVPNEQDFFMRTLLEKRAAYNAVLHVGSNAIFSRQALEDIGGIPTSSITEDMATGMLIQAKGYKSFFVNEPLAIGLSVENINDLIKQRDRWLRGNIQVFKSINPFKTKGLSIVQKMVYFDGVVYWAYGVQKMIYIIAPLLYLLFRVMIFDANGYDVAMMFIPYFLSNALYFRAVSDNGRNITWSHIYETATAPFMAFSFLTELIFSRDLKFNVTPKGEVSNKDIFNWRLAMPHLILAFLSILSIVLNWYYIISYQITNYPALVINLFWCVYNLFGITISIFVYIDRKRHREVERIPVELQLSTLIKSCKFKDNCTSCGLVNDISDNGASINIRKGCEHFTYKVEDKFQISIDEIGVIDCIVKRSVETEDSFNLGVQFENLAFENYVAINQYRFNTTKAYLNNPKINSASSSFGKIFITIIKGVFKQR